MGRPGLKPLRILAVSDIHGRTGLLERIVAAEAPAADVIVASGDLVRFLDAGNLTPILARLAAPRLPVLAVAGNCDGAEVDALLSKAGYNLRGAGRMVGGVGFCGVAGAPPWALHTWSVEEDVAAEWIAEGHAAIAGAKLKVLVAHAPPAEAIVQTSAGASLRLPGSTAVREAVESLDFDAVICGHIHEGQGTGRIGRCLVVCCGAVRDGNYARLVTGGGSAVGGLGSAARDAAGIGPAGPKDTAGNGRGGMVGATLHHLPWA